jgi:hypothetical protein
MAFGGNGDILNLELEMIAEVASNDILNSLRRRRVLGDNLLVSLRLRCKSGIRRHEHGRLDDEHLRFDPSTISIAQTVVDYTHLHSVFAAGWRAD